MKFGENLKLLRKQKNLTQQQLSNSLGVDRTTVMKWETGHYETNFEMLIKIADFFDVSVDYLIGRKDY